MKIYYNPRLKEMAQQLRVGVLYGGFSSERPISLKSGKAVAAGLKSLGYPVRLIDVKSNKPGPVLAALKTCDIAFIALHGEFGEDGQLQTILHKARIPYTGSDAVASKSAMDKFTTKHLFRMRHIPTPPFWIVKGAKNLVNQLRPVYDIVKKGGRVVVKPRSEGSSVGVAVVSDVVKLLAAVTEATKYGPDVLIEKYIPGREFTVGILGDRALPVIELSPYKDFFSYKAKYQSDKTKYIVKPRIPRKLTARLQRVGLNAHRALGCDVFSRVDLIYDPVQDKVYALEVNSIPGMTERSLVPKAARAAGVEFPQLCQEIIRLSMV